MNTVRNAVIAALILASCAIMVTAQEGYERRTLRAPNLRMEPGLKGRVVATVPSKSPLTVSAEAIRAEVIGGVEGQWILADREGVHPKKP